MKAVKLRWSMLSPEKAGSRSWDSSLPRVASWVKLRDRTAPDAVIHMASFGDLARCLSHPRECFDASAVIGMRLLEAVRRSGRPLPFLNHSTDKVYAGHPTPFRETMPLRPANIYELSKATQDQAGQVYARSYGLPVVTIR